jgi:alpha-galactosidase
MRRKLHVPWPAANVDQRYSLKLCPPQFLDVYGRPVPSLSYPSARTGDGGSNSTLAPFVSRVHALGLKVGVWHIRGVHKRAVEERMPVFGTS